MIISKGFFLGTIFWGMLLIFWGASLLLNALFGINIPVIRLFIGGLLIYFGFSLISHSGRNQESFNSYWFSHNIIRAKHLQNEVRVSFSNSTIDLRTIPSSGNTPVVIKTFCSNVHLITNPLVTTKVVINSNFSRTQYLNKETVTNCEFVINPENGLTEQEVVINLSCSNLEID